ncbi:MAG: hypothetical protein DMG50_20535 [Acidobacteria bacterium]|nr:MAG: hypothetical protein DMG50_20535 [Acidobacteriota bacterium]
MGDPGVRQRGGAGRGQAIHPCSASMIIRKIPEARTHTHRKEAQPMMNDSEGLANQGIQRILELSADAHIRRRGTVKDSPEFHSLSGAIAAYGKALELLTAMQELEEFYAMIDQLDVPASAQPVC